MKQLGALVFKIALIVGLAVGAPEAVSWLSDLDVRESLSKLDPSEYGRSASRTLTGDEVCQGWQRRATTINPEAFDTKEYVTLKDGDRFLQLSEDEYRGVELLRRYNFAIVDTVEVLTPNGTKVLVPGEEKIEMYQWNKFKYKGSGCMYFTQSNSKHKERQIEANIAHLNR